MPRTCGCRRACATPAPARWKRAHRRLGKELIANGSFENVGRAICLPDGPPAPFEEQRNTAWRTWPGRASARSKSPPKRPPSMASTSMSRWIATRSTNSAPGSRPRRWQGGGRGAQLYISGHPDSPGSKAVKGTEDWTQVKMRFNTGAATVGEHPLPVRRLGHRHRQGVVGRRQSAQGRV